MCSTENVSRPSSRSKFASMMTVRRLRFALEPEMSPIERFFLLSSSRRISGETDTTHSVPGRVDGADLARRRARALLRALADVSARTLPACGPRARGVHELVGKRPRVGSWLRGIARAVEGRAGDAGPRIIAGDGGCSISKANLDGDGDVVCGALTNSMLLRTRSGSLSIAQRECARGLLSLSGSASG